MGISLECVKKDGGAVGSRRGAQARGVSFLGGLNVSPAPHVASGEVSIWKRNPIV